MEKVPFDESKFEEDLKNGGVNNQNYKTKLLVPKDPKLATVDALILPNKCLQITKQARGHSIAATKCFVNILEKMKRFCENEGINIDQDKVEDEKPFCFFFVVPESLFLSFGSQHVQCNEDLSENYKAIELTKECLKEIKEIEDIVTEKLKW